MLTRAIAPEETVGWSACILGGNETRETRAFTAGTGAARRPRMPRIFASCALTLTLLLAAFSGTACSTDGDCTEQSCDGFGGSASRKFTSCYSSGSGSTKDKFVLKDADDNEFHSCSRAANDNDGCGVELIAAKEAYCAASAGPASKGTTSSSSGGSSSGDAESP